ncbi:MAG: formamidopyrimidine-DNA glycosylase [Gemmatimonadetes bacterium]|nr:formamidopyrimidine-DNA glycosylase [Gemmatimonadota bacterium]
MPELPDITVYVEALRARVLGQALEHATILNLFVLRTVEPPLSAFEGLAVTGVERLGKRIVIGFAGEHWLVIHLMVAGRLAWIARTARPNRGTGLVALEFPGGTLVLTEAGSKRRASLHALRGAGALAEHDRGGLEVLDATLARFATRLRSERHTVKRALADPRLFSGIGNAYSDEILLRAQLSPMARTDTMDDATVARLFAATRSILVEWTDRLRSEAADRWPAKVTAFRPEMVVHGKFGQPCAVCGAPVQRIRYAENETNYCARCQTGGRLLADRALSRLLRDDWPRSLDEL